MQGGGMRRGDGATWSAFLAMAFVVVGLVGAFASFASALPYQRGLHELAALDAVPPEATPAALLALRPRLADEGRLVIDGAGPLPGRIASARRALLARVAIEGGAVGERVRLLIVVFTIVAALFGAMVISVTRRTA